MTTSMYCLYVGFDYTYIDINALAQGIKSFLASQVWFQPLVGIGPMACMYYVFTYVCMCVYVYMYVCIYVCMYAYMCVCMY